MYLAIKWAVNTFQFYRFDCPCSKRVALHIFNLSCNVQLINYNTWRVGYYK